MYTKTSDSTLSLQHTIHGILLISLIFAFFLQAARAHAGIYKYVDENGVIHFTNVPSSPQYVLYIEEEGGTESRHYGDDQFDDLIQEAAEEYDIDPALVKAIIRVESDFDPWAISRKGAIGLMQLLPETAEGLSVINIFDPRENIYGGVRHLSELLDVFQNDLELSLAAYNAGKSAVLQFMSIPPYDETQRFVKKVLRFYQAYRE
jgi:hypothetical protein